MADETTSNPATSSSKRKAEWFDIAEDNNTYVYVTGLPTSTTEEDFVDLMKKYGIIAKKSIPGSPFNVKLYKNQDGTFKGDALCKFVRVESVDLALDHLDGYNYDDKHIIHCERAKFQMKGSYDPTKKPRVDPKTKIKQKKSIDKLLSWETKEPPEVRQKKVILRYMFTPEEILEDAGLLLDIKEDVETKCSEFSCEPKRVDIYDKHPDGIVAVTFEEPSQAQSCIQALDNQFYAGRTVKAELWDGKTNYKVKETDEESERRLEKWQRDIERDDDESGDKTRSSSNIEQNPSNTDVEPIDRTAKTNNTQDLPQDQEPAKTL